MAHMRKPLLLGEIMNNLLNKLLSQLADEIDISDSQEGVVRRAYNSVADWLNQKNTLIAKHQVHIFPQGSIMYGTAIKPINEDDYDIDLVCEFTAQTENISPSYVKQSVGQRLKENATYKKMLDEEGRRCWTLKYSDNLNFHMDILPAIPFQEKYRTDSRFKEAFNSITNNRELALLATDKDKISELYKYIPTNPRGYAEWFKGRVQTNKRKLIFDSIERIPEQQEHKTVLQKAIQLLKRYRDVVFEANEDLKPISMIITTLVAKSYNGEENLYEFICRAIEKMPTFIERGINGEYIIKNPVMSSENFADKWKEKPEKAKSFFQWIAKAKTDFTRLAKISSYTEYDKVFKEMFSQKPVDRLMEKYKHNLQQEREVAATLGVVEKPASLVALEKIKHRVTPPWVLPRGFRVKIDAQVSYDGGETYSSFESNTLLPKHVNLRFFPLHSISSPYKVKWQITNTGTEAFNANCLRGNLFENGDITRFGMQSGKQEYTAYSGVHYVQCFIIKNGNQCVGASEPFVVRIQ